MKCVKNRAKRYVFFFFIIFECFSITTNFPPLKVLIFFQLGKHIDQCALIFDMDGIGMKHLWKPGMKVKIENFYITFPVIRIKFCFAAVDTFIEMLIMFEANYPETLRYCFVINGENYLPQSQNNTWKCVIFHMTLYSYFCSTKNIPNRLESGKSIPVWRHQEKNICGWK